MDKWIENNSKKISGGKMRADRGIAIELYVKNIINNIGINLNINLIALTGSNDKKILIINKPDGKEIKKNHQVDVHIYLNNLFIACIECKSYLDSCYYVRACNDFELFKKFNYNLKNFI